MTTTASPAVHERRPTLEDLKQRAEEGRYGGGSGRMDSREWYELCYFEPLEDFLYEALERKYYPKMDARNISVCVSLWICDHSVLPLPTYEQISDRILWTESYDMGAEVIRGRTTPEKAIEDTLKRGFISLKTDEEIDETYVTLRQDIEQFLSELVDKECAESDAAIIAAHGKEAFDHITEIHREKQLEFERWASPFYYRKEEKRDDSSNNNHRYQ